MSESKAAAVNFAEKRMIILVELRIALSRHASVTHHDIYTVRNMYFHLPSGKGTLVNSQTVVKVICNAGRICAAHLAFTR